MSNYEIPRSEANQYAGIQRIGDISVVIFYACGGSDCDLKVAFAEAGMQPEPGGWYWWACQPGCLPEGDPQGPFPTSQDAHEDAFASYAEEELERQLRDNATAQFHGPLRDGS